MTEEADTKPKSQFKIIKALWVVFGISVLVFLLDFNYVIVVRKVLFNEISGVYAFTLLGAILIGCISFFLAVIFGLLKKHLKGNKLTFSKFLLFSLTLPILPIYLLISNLRDKNQVILKRLIKGIGLFIILVPFWILGYTVLYYVSTDELLLGTRYQVSPIAYSESMLPTFKPGTIGKYYPYKNILYKLNPNWAYKISRGDIISFKNNATAEYLLKDGIDSYQDFAKRVIAVGGDRVELKAGYVILDGKPLIEPYTLEPGSTYALTEAYKKAQLVGLGGLFLKECEEITVPQGKLFVLGDNRANSNDSRVIGFVDLKDIHGYFPYEEQKEPFTEGVNTILYSEAWRGVPESIDPNVLQKINSYCI